MPHECLHPPCTAPTIHRCGFWMAYWSLHPMAGQDLYTHQEWNQAQSMFLQLLEQPPESGELWKNWEAGKGQFHLGRSLSTHGFKHFSTQCNIISMFVHAFMHGVLCFLGKALNSLSQSYHLLYLWIWTAAWATSHQQSCQDKPSIALLTQKTT